MRPSWESRLYPVIPATFDLKAFGAHTPSTPTFAAVEAAKDPSATPLIDRYVFRYISTFTQFIPVLVRNCSFSSVSLCSWPGRKFTTSRLCRVNELVPALSRTYKLYYGGAQKRPDGMYSAPVVDAEGLIVAHVSDSNRKDVRYVYY